jgi:DNA adenine methylase
MNNVLRLQPIPYQGSKRLLAPVIFSYAPSKISRLVEPFAGSAAVTLFAATNQIASEFVINDSYEPLIELWRLILSNPDLVSKSYEEIWKKQNDSGPDYYFEIRNKFNSNQDPSLLLYLMTRCAKNAVRFNSKGEFNQSHDKRRLGRNPILMREQLLKTSNLLKGKTTLTSIDYEKCLQSTSVNDFVYMDPPYQGTSSGKNPRYHQGLDFDKFVLNLEKLNQNNINFIISFDGKSGTTDYGKPLPLSLRLKQISINAGRSAQATLNGRSEITFESLYVSHTLSEQI